MTITFNGAQVEMTPGTVADLLTGCLGDRRPPGVAVAVNDQVVPRADWAETVLADGDRVEVVTAVQGG